VGCYLFQESLSMFQNVVLAWQRNVYNIAFQLYSSFAMENIFIKVFSFIFMILIAYVLKALGVVRKEDSKPLAEIVMKLTLPAAIIASFDGYVLNRSLLLLVILGLSGALLHFFVFFIISLKKGRNEKISYLLGSAYNIGNFSLPFASNLLGPTGTVPVCLFDAGNAIMCLGGNLVFTEMAIGGKAKSLKDSAKQMLRVFKSFAFDSYLVIFVLLLLNIELPSPIFKVAHEISLANGPMAMFMIGISLEIKASREYLKTASIVMIARLMIAGIISFIAYRMAFLSPEEKKAVAIVAFSPIASANVAYVVFLKGDSDLVSFENTVSILFSMVTIPILSLAL